jgi:hypothetical protein
VRRRFSQITGFSVASARPRYQEASARISLGLVIIVISGDSTATGPFKKSLARDEPIAFDFRKHAARHRAQLKCGDVPIGFTMFISRGRTSSISDAKYFVGM